MLLQILEEIRDLAREYATPNNLRDNFLVHSVGFGAPTVLWMKDGNPVAGIEVVLQGMTPHYVHQSDCANAERMMSKKSPTGFMAAARAVNRWISFVRSARSLRARYAQSSGPSIPDHGLPPLIRLYANQSCSCGKVASKPSQATELSWRGGTEANAVLGKARTVIARYIAAMVATEPISDGSLLQLVSRLVKYGRSRPTNEPRPISKKAADEIRQMSLPRSAVAIRYGPAGSGKTSMLAGAAARMSREGKRVLIVTVTSAAREVIKERIETRTRAIRDLVDCRMLTELLPRAVKRGVLKASRQEKKALQDSDFSSMFKKSQGTDAQVHLRDYDALLIDEAEDLLPEHWKYLLGADGAVLTVDHERDLKQIFVAFDDAQSVLGDGGRQHRTFETCGPDQWARSIFSKSGGSNVQELQSLIRTKWAETVPDSRWMRFNLRQSGMLEAQSSNHRRSFRPNDATIESGLDGSHGTEAEERICTSFSEAIEASLKVVEESEDCMVVSQSRLLNMVSTLSVERPNNIFCQEVFIESPFFNFANQRGERVRNGVFLEAPLPFELADIEHLDVENHGGGELSDGEDQTSETELDRAHLDGPDAPPANSEDALCGYAHHQLWGTRSAMRGQLRPLDPRTRILTIPQSRGFEAKTAVVFVPSREDARHFTDESEYVAITRPQERLVRIVLPPLERIESESSLQARIWRALRRLRADQDLTGALWPLVQVDLDRWTPDEENVQLLEHELPAKVLDWAHALEKVAVELVKKRPDAPRHCLTHFVPVDGAPKPRGPVDHRFDYGAWLVALKPNRS